MFCRGQVDPPQWTWRNILRGSIIVAVGDPYRSACTLGQAKREAAIVVNVTVHDVVRTVRRKNTSKVFSVTPWPARAKARKDSAPEGPNFVIVGTWLRSMDHKV